jgi:C4-dicarboxylate-specific signal transduction histidine kinase
MGSVVGAIAFDSFHSYGNWSEELVGRLRLIGDIFTHVLVRKRIDRALKQAEEEARRFRDELARATRIELASQLTTSIAHEVNQPLCAIASNAQTALDLLELGDTQELKQTLHDIYGDARRASEVIACIRNMIKKGEPKRASHDLGSLVGEIEPILRRESAARGVKLSIDVEANQSRVVCDRVQIQQVVLNLVLNAVEAVSTANVARTEVHIRVGSQPDGAHLRVEDSAVGLSPEVCERIFAPFFTTKAVGLGMGLTISRSIITAHGGRIWATPGSRGGTIVQFQLPGA